MKYCIQFRDKMLPISEEEVPKVIQAMDEKKIVMLKCGIINGAFISAITRDIHAERGYSYGYNIERETTRKDYVCEFENILTNINKNKMIGSGE